MSIVHWPPRAVRWILGAIIAVAAIITFAAEPTAASSAGPSFDCARVTSHVNRMVCADSNLSALDRKLADDFDSTLHQGGVDAKALQAEEDHWLKSVRGACADAPCLAAAYAARDQAILDMSAKAASPAAYAETRPFPAPAALLASAKALIGKPCGGAPSRPLPGFRKIFGFLPIVGRGSFVAPLQSKGVRFAFLLTYPGEDFGQCVVADVVVLPAAQAGESFMQCSLAVDDSHGFGLRTRVKTVYWSVDPANAHLNREPLGVLGDAHPVCQEPETGE